MDQYSLRRTDAQKNQFSWDRQMREDPFRTIEYTAPASANDLPVAYQTDGVFTPAFTGETSPTDVMCGGVPVLNGSRFGVAYNDVKLGEKSSVVVDGKGMLLVPAAITWEDGDKAYLIPFATEETGGLITNTDGGGANIQIGQFVGASTDADSRKVVSSLSPLRLPDGCYGKIWWFPTV